MRRVARVVYAITRGSCTSLFARERERENARNVIAIASAIAIAVAICNGDSSIASYVIWQFRRGYDGCNDLG